MQIACKRISIKDTVLNCQIAFSGKPEIGEAFHKMTLNQIAESLGDYLLLHRSYPQNASEMDTYYFETRDSNFSGTLESFEIVLSRKSFELRLPKKTIKVSINPTEEQFAELKRVLPILINNPGMLTIHE